MSPSPVIAPLDVLDGMSDMIGSKTVIPAPLQSSADAFPALVSTIISLRTRDAVTTQVSAAVYRRAPDPVTMASMEQEELEELLRPAGFYRRKAGQLIRIAAQILEEHDGMVPNSREALLALPGVGLKTANFVLGMVFGIPSICVDVHVHRISNRLGLVSTSTPEDTEVALRNIFPEDWWSRINHVMVRFGQTICRPVGPRCAECLFRGWCPEAASRISQHELDKRSGSR